MTKCELKSQINSETPSTIVDDVASFREVLEGRDIHRGGEGTFYKFSKYFIFNFCVFFFKVLHNFQYHKMIFFL